MHYYHLALTVTVTTPLDAFECYVCDRGDETLVAEPSHFDCGCQTTTGNLLRSFYKTGLLFFFSLFFSSTCNILHVPYGYSNTLTRICICINVIGGHSSSMYMVCVYMYILYMYVCMCMYACVRVFISPFVHCHHAYIC
jgi:hypothetical protein